jgi:hypothetical protein
MITNEPAPGTSVMSFIILPPSRRTLSVAALRSSTST